MKLISLAKCVPTILKLNWNQRFRDKKTKLNIFHRMLTSSTQLQNRSFHVVERTKTSAICQKLKNCTCKACKTIVFRYQICKFVTFMLLSSSWLRKLPIVWNGPCQFLRLNHMHPGRCHLVFHILFFQIRPSCRLESRMAKELCQATGERAERTQQTNGHSEKGD